MIWWLNDINKAKLLTWMMTWLDPEHTPEDFYLLQQKKSLRGVKMHSSPKQQIKERNLLQR